MGNMRRLDTPPAADLPQVRPRTSVAAELEAYGQIADIMARLDPDAQVRAARFTAERWYIGAEAGTR